MLVEAKLRLFLIAKTPVKALFLPPKVCNCSFIKNHYILVGRRVICTIYSVLVKIKKNFNYRKFWSNSGFQRVMKNVFFVPLNC